MNGFLVQLDLSATNNDHFFLRRPSTFQFVSENGGQTLIYILSRYETC